MLKDVKEEKKENRKLSAKRWVSYFLLAVCIIIVYKILDNFGNVQQWFVTLKAIFSRNFYSIYFNVTM